METLFVIVGSGIIERSTQPFAYEMDWMGSAGTCSSLTTTTADFSCGVGDEAVTESDESELEGSDEDDGDNG